MSIASDTLAFFRTEWADRLVDTCTIDRTTNKGTLNTSTGAYSAATTSQIYSGACLWRRSGREATKRTLSDVAASSQYAVVFVPNTVVGVERDDTITITAATDPDAIGIWQVVSAEVDAYANSREIIVDRIEKSGWPR